MAIAQAVGLAEGVGTATASGVGIGVVNAVGLSQGTSTVFGISESIEQKQGGVGGDEEDYEYLKSVEKRIVAARKKREAEAIQPEDKIQPVIAPKAEEVIVQTVVQVPKSIEAVSLLPSIDDLSKVGQLVGEASKEIARKVKEHRQAKVEREAQALAEVAIAEAKRRKDEEEVLIMMIMAIEADEESQQA